MEKWRETLSLGPFSSSFVKQQQPFLPKEKNKTSSRLSKLLVFILQGERERHCASVYLRRACPVYRLSPVWGLLPLLRVFILDLDIYIYFLFLSFFLFSPLKSLHSFSLACLVRSFSLSLLIFYLSVTETLKAGEELNLICRFLFFFFFFWTACVSRLEEFVIAL